MPVKPSLLVLLLASACATDPASNDTPSQPLQVGRCPGAATNPFFIGNLEIQGTILHAEVAGGGGCRPHSFSVCWNGAVADSYPPQVSLELAYDAHGDPCDALITHDVQIDLTSLPDWVGRPVVFHISGAKGQIPDSTNSVTYE